MLMLNSLLRSFVQTGSLTVTDADGRKHIYAGKPGPNVTVALHDRSLHTRLVTNTDLAAAEGYMDGKITLEDGTTLRDLLSFYFVNQDGLLHHPLVRVFDRVSYFTRRLQQSNRLGEARRHVSHHYDIGNALYRLFLDENMVYSCAYFRHGDETLEEAQIAKHRLIAAKMQLEPGQSVLDIGSGWGGMAIYLARVADVKVKGVTLSTEQLEIARERAEAAGVADRVTFELRDYRELDEKFDRIVSIGMFEHVGVQHFDEFFGKVHSLLDDDGVMLLHSIGSSAPPSTASSFYRKYIFPGGYIPSLSEVYAALERNRLWGLDVENLRIHYAETLRHWHERFAANRDKVVELYDERFARMWEFYLASAEMMFRGGSQHVFHLQIAKRRDAVPLTRDYIVERQHELEEAERVKLAQRAA